jgi:hypothetical protein
MDRATLEHFLREAESLLHRGERNIAHQREVIGTLERGGHDATAAKMFLRRLESAQARHIAKSIVQGTGRAVLVGDAAGAHTARIADIGITARTGSESLRLPPP